jgi:hypothetical protein
MTVERYFLDGYRDEALYDELKASDTFPLVRELEFKYGLKVFRSIPSPRRSSRHPRCPC